MLHPTRRPRSMRLHASSPSVVEALEGRVLLSAYVVSNNLDSGPGSLRDDIVMSNVAGGSNTITFAPGLSGTITLTSGQLEIFNDLTITGPGAASLTISGNTKSRVFQVDSGKTASISGVTIADGLASAPAEPVGGGVYNLGSLSLSFSVIRGDTVGNGGSGGGIYNTGSLTLSHNTIADNSAGTTGGAGGGIYNAGTLTSSRDTFQANAAGPGGGSGGGIFNQGSATLSQDAISGNLAGSAGGWGGGIYSSSFLTIEASTIGGNAAGNGYDTSGVNPPAPGSGGSGGGIVAGGPTVIVNSTIANNRAGFGGHVVQTGLPPYAGNGGSGGGILVFTGAHVNLANCTISGNTVPPQQIPSGLAGSGGGIDVAVNGIAVVTNAIVAANSGGASPDVSGNLDPSSSHNLIGGDPRLDSLGNYGGPTQTIALLAGSPAIDAGSNALAVGPDGQPLLTDQRGLPRIVNGTVDIGAYEVQQTPVVNTTDDETTRGDGKVSLREAVTLVDLDSGPEIGPITFDPKVFSTGTVHTINLAQGQLELSDRYIPMTIRGPGANMLTINVGGSSRVFQVDAGVGASISGLMITGGSADQGGAISNSGTLSIDSCALTGNLASSSGGAIYNSSSGQLTVSNSTFSADSAGNSGGGIFNAVTGQLLVSNSTFWGDSAGGGSPSFPAQLAGGAIANASGATITNCTIANNSATGASQGGGIANAAALTLQNSIVAGNAGGDVAGTLASSSSYNLVGDGSGGLAFANHNLFGTNASPLDAKLAPLGDYGGPLQTVALLPGSPAIDMGSNFLAATAHLSQDERGFPRVSNGTVDIGAYEAQTLTVVNTTADESTAGDASLSLREAVALADADKGPEAFTITFAPGVTGTIGLTSGQLELNRTSGAVTIRGPAANALSVVGGVFSRVFQIGLAVSAKIDGLTIWGSADRGGGVLNLGTLALTGCAFTSNRATMYGGGIFNAGRLTISDSTFSSDVSDNAGGGIYNAQGANLTIVNSTFASNQSGGGAADPALEQGGGGIANDGTMVLTNATISGNFLTGSTGAGIATRGSAMLYNTIVAPDDIAGVIDPASSRNLIGGNPLLSDLENNGGPTQTRVPLPASPALEAGDNAAAQAAGLMTDQRGLPRFASGTVDIGAVEMQHILVVNSMADDATISGGQLTLREAVALPDDRSAPVTFASGLAGTIALTRGPLVLGSVVIQGPGSNVIAVDGQSKWTVFQVNGGATAEIDGLEVTHGFGGNQGGGGIHNRGVLTLRDDRIDHNTASLVSGGGIYNDVVLTMSNCTVDDNGDAKIAGGGGIFTDGPTTASDCNITANMGGGILVSAPADFDIVRLIRCTISGNSSNQIITGYGGGGIDTTITSPAPQGLLSLTDCTINNNEAVDGGGISASMRIALTGCTLTNNTAQDAGGAIYYRGGTGTVVDCIITGNHSTTSGGAIYNLGTLTLTNSTTGANMAQAVGGGIDSGGTLNVVGSSIINNTAATGGGGLYNHARSTASLANSTISGNQTCQDPILVPTPRYSFTAQTHRI